MIRIKASRAVAVRTRAVALTTVVTTGALAVTTRAFAVTTAVTTTAIATFVTATLLAITCGAAIKAEPSHQPPPQLPAPKPFKMPAVQKFKLSNGLKVELVEDHRVPYVTAFVGIKAGSVLDDPNKLGVAELTADLITEGTEARKSKQIADQIDFIGGSLDAFSDYDFTVLNASSLSDYSDRLFSLMSDVLINPSFPEDELKLKKTNLIQELTMQRSQPSYLLKERFRRVVFGNHPYGIVSPKPEMIANISRDDLRKFHEHCYVPNESVLLVVGDIEAPRAKHLIEASFGSWRAGEHRDLTLPAVAGQKGRRIYLVDRPGSVQSSLMIGNIGIKKKDPDYFAAKVMNQILGGGAHARLFLNIREQKGYTYGAYSNLSARVFPDTFTSSADVRTEVTAASLKEFFFELERMRNSAVSQKELDDAKNYIAGQFQLSLETQNGLAQHLLEVNMHDLPDDYLETFANKIMAVSADDVQKVAQRLVQDKDLVIAVVGDAKKIKAELEPFAPIEVYDIDGQLTNKTGSGYVPGS